MTNFALSNKDSIPLRWKKLRPALSNGGLFFIMKQSYPTQRVIVYVDGFNFYYGIKKKPWNKYYWLDIVKLFEQFMLPHQELVAVKYFSARPLGDPDKSLRQNAFFQANLENRKFKLILGKYLKKRLECFKCHNIINTYEEKESDVNLATQIVADAYQDNCDIVIIVSADSDMIPAIDLAREAGKKVFIYFPPNHKSSNLRILAGMRPTWLERYEGRFKNAMLPDRITLKNGFELKIPEPWRIVRDGK